MYRAVSLIISLGVGGFAGWWVYGKYTEVFDNLPVGLGIASGCGILVTVLLHFPLLRHIADMIEERVSTLGARMTSRKTGVDLDSIPMSSIPPSSPRRVTTTSNKALCSICHGPGGPVCDKCHERMSKPPPAPSS